jgi:hypothetical protein
VLEITICLLKYHSGVGFGYTVVFSCAAVSQEEFAISDITYLLIELKLLYIFSKSPGAVRQIRQV